MEHSFNSLSYTYTSPKKMYCNMSWLEVWWKYALSGATQAASATQILADLHSVSPTAINILEGKAAGSKG